MKPISWSKKIHRFRVYLIIQALVVAGVILSFKVIPDKKWASLLAGSLFVVGNLLVLALERRRPDFKRHITYWVTLAFFLSAAVPIFFLRIFNWQRDFTDLALFGIPAPLWHQYSNWAFMIMLMGYFVDSYLWDRRAEASEK